MSDDLRDFIRAARGLTGMDGLVVLGGLAFPTPYAQTDEGQTAWERRYGPEEPAPPEVAPPPAPRDDHGLGRLLEAGGLRLEKPDL